MIYQFHICWSICLHLITYPQKKENQTLEQVTVITASFGAKLAKIPSWCGAAWHDDLGPLAFTSLNHTSRFGVPKACLTASKITGWQTSWAAQGYNKCNLKRCSPTNSSAVADGPTTCWACWSNFSNASAASAALSGLSGAQKPSSAKRHGNTGANGAVSRGRLARRLQVQDQVLGTATKSRRRSSKWRYLGLDTVNGSIPEAFYHSPCKVH